MSKQCLIIDDDLDDQEIFLMCLSEINHTIHCRTCNSGVDAVAMLESNPSYFPHYIFIDVNMPKMSGLTCLRILKGIKRLHDAKFFMYSTTSEQSTLETSKNLGAQDFIIKPVKTAELKAKLVDIFADMNPDDLNKVS